MAYRCSSCNKFSSLDEPEFEASVPTFDEDTGDIEMGVEASFPSACCGQEAATASYTPTGSIDMEDFKHEEGCSGAVYEVEAEEPVATDRFQQKDRHGKPITKARYQRHYYGVEVEVTVTCSGCGASQTTNIDDEQGPPDEVY